MEILNQKDGVPAYVCGNRCPLASSDNITAARAWARNGSSLAQEASGISLIDQDLASRCRMSMDLTRLCEIIDPDVGMHVPPAASSTS